MWMAGFHTFHDMQWRGVIREARSRKMKEKKQIDIEPKNANTDNQREARVGQSQSPSGKGLVNCIFGYRIACSQ